MKQTFASLLLLGMLLSTVPAFSQISTPSPSPAATLTQMVGLTKVEFEYSRPSVKGRTIFGDLVPFDAIWRTGANGATKVTFSSDVKLEGNSVTAGSYALYTIPGESSWTVMLYNDLSLGGNVGSYKAENEALRFKVTPQSMPFSAESFVINMDNLTANSATIYLIWDKTMVPINLEVLDDAKVMASIERVMAGPGANDYYQAAMYYYQTDRDIDQALVWIDLALEKGGDRYWIMTNKARILGKMGNKKEATTVARRAKEMAKEAGNEDYVKINDGLIKEFGS